MPARPVLSGPARLGEALPATSAELDGLARLRAEHPDADGSARLLVELADGQTVEGVLLPHAPSIDPAELAELGERYAHATGYPVQYPWTLLEGVNDGDDELDGIVRPLAGKYAIMNFIPYNEVDGLGFRRPAWQRAVTMTRHLHRHGILSALRNSAGQEVEGACGQLRARSISTDRIVRVQARRAVSATVA